MRKPVAKGNFKAPVEKKVLQKVHQLKAAVVSVMIGFNKVQKSRKSHAH